MSIYLGIIGGVAAFILVLLVMLKIANARAKKASERMILERERREKADKTLEAAILRNVAIKTAKINQEQKNREEQARIDSGKRDSFDKDTF